MTKPRIAGGATGNSGETVKTSLARPQLVSIPIRFMFSHCPGCGDPFDDKPPHVIGKFVRDDLTRAILYHLCKPCGVRLYKAGKRRRRILTERIERNLEEHGAFVGIVRTGMQA